MIKQVKKLESSWLDIPQYKRKSLSNGVVKGTLQLISNYIVKPKMTQFVISKDWDSQLPTNFNSKSMIWGAVGNNDFGLQCWQKSLLVHFRSS